MGTFIGLKAWRRKFDVSGKLGCNINLSGEEARAVIEFMEAEDLPNPASAVRVLIAAALETYPEWGANVAARRQAVNEQRHWALRRLVDALTEITAEAELNFAEGRAAQEEARIEAASNAVLEGDE